eukprot:16333998-Heterocapsa_arctica.AAC.1
MPLGNGTIAREIKGNLQLHHMVRIIEALARREILEYRESTYFTDMACPMKRLLARDDVFMVHFVQCEYFLTPPEHAGH